ncbi:hypothetical protein [Fusobacterium polymorphum]|uniref:hypothetical protein n=1 Tax=Fusobacterium nucleatum subsp. polymorphum TaxID=76857 RepID=UPI00300A5F98
MKKIIIMELILVFSIFYLIKYVPNYENTILVLKDDIKIEENRLNSTYYISIYLLQYLLFIFLVIYL